MTTPPSPDAPAHKQSPKKWTSLSSHRNWLLQQAENIFAFFEQRSIDPRGGFFDLDDAGNFPLAHPPAACCMPPPA